MSTFGQLLIDTKYANFLSGRLQKFRIVKSHPFTARFRCPYCGDSSKSSTKTRGYLYKAKDDNDLWFACHNGCAGRSFGNFLKDQDPTLHKEYVYESFLERNPTAQRTNSDRVERTPDTNCKEDHNPLTNIKRLSDLREDHPARVYAKNRSLPPKALEILYYTPNFIKFTNSIIPGKLREFKDDEPRLIIPFIDRNGKLFGYQGRSFFKHTMRYISIMIDEQQTKLFGYDRVNLNKKIYILEGGLDSLFLDNAVATAQGDLTAADHLFKGKRCVYIPDKDRRNREIIKLIEKLIVLNKSVCLLPQDLPGKDLNEAVQSGIDPNDIQRIVDENTFSGARLQLEFNLWKKT